MKLSKALKDVLAERELQKTEEGWRPNSIAPDVLAAGAACYAASAGLPPHEGREVVARSWPWAFNWWRDLTPRAALVRAAALALDAIEAIDRASALGVGQSPSMEPSADERRDLVARLIEAQIASLSAENEQLTRWLQTRDLWIVEKGLWPDFTRDVETNANHIDALRAENERLTKERDDANECLTIAYMQGAASVRERAQAAEAARNEALLTIDQLKIGLETAETIARAAEAALAELREAVNNVAKAPGGWLISLTGAFASRAQRADFESRDDCMDDYEYAKEFVSSVQRLRSLANKEGK